MLALRPFQVQAIQHLDLPQSQSIHLICVAATGSGKSLIYERIALAPQRRILLITPLVALARQQYNRLKSQGISVSLGSGGGPLANASPQGPPMTQSGAWIISPETLQFSFRQNQMQNWRPNLLVVDECHCLWDWGEHFRPAFSLIPNILAKYSIPHSLWLTATLPPEARAQLRKSLPTPQKEMGRFELPLQITLLIKRVEWRNRSTILLQWIFQQTGAGIIFVATREATLRVAKLIAATGKKSVAYHGGMSKEERQNIEAEIRKGLPLVIVATSAFGMGMDYPHLRYCALWQAPTSILSLVQIVGRVGRNSEQNGQALVLWDSDDFRMLEWTIGDSGIRRKEMQNLLNFLGDEKCRRQALREYFDPQSPLPPPTRCSRCDFCIGI